MQYLKLPFEGAPASSWEDDQVGLEHGIKTFSAHPEKNLLAIFEEWLDHIRWVTQIPKLLHIGSTNLWNA